MNSTMNKVQRHVKDARIMYNALNGVFVVYKPTGLSFSKVRGTIISNLCRGFDVFSIYYRLFKQSDLRSFSVCFRSQ